MITISGYKLDDKLYESNRSFVYRGRRDRDGKPVILKVLRRKQPTLEEIARFKREFEITCGLQAEGAINAFDLEPYQNSLIMVMEDFGGESLIRLKELAGLELNLIEFLRLAIRITEILAGIHRQNVIHKDINPTNIVWNPKIDKVKIIDFGISTTLPQETVEYTAPNRLEGTLPYISPEQTGRMNRSVDYRTDFYSLGVTFYELLTGLWPFVTRDPLELVHAHIAKMPVEPCEIRRKPEGLERPGFTPIPKTLSDIVIKLMAKNAEERYQSAVGLKYDLQKCLEQLTVTGKIETFEIGQADYSETFQIPQKLYGRQAEIETLLAAFERVSEGTTEMALVAGYSGIGKTSLVQEIHKPVVEKQGYFISGKFDQFKRNIPYASFIEAFQGLIHQLLAESKAQVAGWRAKIAKAVGVNGQVIIDVIPDVELIIGQQPPVPGLSPTESQNRFNYVFQNFIRVFAGPEHPLIIFLDDLQWIDLPSLKLIELFVSDPDTSHLLFIGAYRDNEVEPTHPLMLTISGLNELGRNVSTITLPPLGAADVNQLIAEALHCHSETSKLLSELCLQKTGGNPFFLNQFLQTLYRQHLLEFDREQTRWRWDIEAIELAGITGNVAELMVEKLQQLPVKTQDALKISAAIGVRFSLKILSLVTGKRYQETAQDLWAAMQEHFIFPTDERYKYAGISDQLDFGEFGEQAEYQFAHDRIQEAAYSLIDKGAQPATHLKIGRSMLENMSKEEQDERIFDIVNQFNQGVNLFQDSQERMQVARLNQITGDRAISAMASASAVQYFRTGLVLLEKNGWKEQYSLTLELTCGLIESFYLTSSYERAKDLCNIALDHVQGSLDRVRIYSLMCYNFTLQNRMEETLTTGLQALEILNIPLVKSPLENINIDRLGDLHEMTEPDILAAMSILVSIISCALVTQSSLMMPLVYTMVDLISRYGNCSKSPFGYVWYGCILCWTGQDIELGYRFGRLAIDIMKKFNAREIETTVLHQFNSFIRHWCEHERNSINNFPHIVQVSKETGDIEYGTYVAVNYVTNLLLVGEPLASVQEKQRPYLDWVASTKFSFSMTYGNIFAQTTQCLMGQGFSDRLLQGDFLDEEAMIPEMKEAKNNLNLFAVYAAKAMLAYFNSRFQESADFARKSEQYEAAIGGLLPVTLAPFYGALALLKITSDGASTDINKSLEIFKDKLSRWAEHGPMNFQHKYDLVKAQKARIVGQIIEAEALYEQAIKGAGKNEYIQDQALAYELAAEFYLERGMEKIAQTYMGEAHYLYRLWGAACKVKEMESKYPHLLAAIFTAPKSPGITAVGITTPVADTGEKVIELLDVSSLMKATRVLSAEIVLSELLKKMMRIIFENAGAQKGIVVLQHEGELFIEAEGAFDQDDILLAQPIPLAEASSDRQPSGLLRYVSRTQKSLVLNDASSEGDFTNDRYILANKPQSLLCMPILHQSHLIGLIYLENNLAKGAFTADRLELVHILSAQAAISIENARLYARQEQYSQTLEQKVVERTQGLQESLKRLKQEVGERTRVEEQLKAALDEKEILLKEVYHRVKNNMTALEYLIEMQADEGNRSPELVDALEELQGRVRAMGLVHQKLYQTTDLAQIDFGEYLEEMTAQLFNALGGNRPISLCVKAANIFVDAKLALTCGLIVNELVTNALKYAFPASFHLEKIEGGQAKQEIHIAFEAGEDEYILVVGDNGVGLPHELDWQATESLGMRLVTLWASYQLQGNLQVDTRNGTVFTLRFPKE